MRGPRYDDCVDGRAGQQPQELYLLLRQWYNVAPSLEFRCFVKQHALVGTMRMQGAPWPVVSTFISVA